MLKMYMRIVIIVVLITLGYLQSYSQTAVPEKYLHWNYKNKINDLTGNLEHDASVFATEKLNLADANGDETLALIDVSREGGAFLIQLYISTNEFLWVNKVYP